MQTTTHDIIIVGGGMVGLTLACALAQQTSLSIAVLEAQPASIAWSEAEYHHRVSAFALSSRRILQSLNVWENIKKKRVSPFTEIKVWDAAKLGEIHFDSKDIAEPVLGYIIENNVVQSALFEKLLHYPQINYLAPVQLLDVEVQEKQAKVHLADNPSLSAKLIVAADGAHSWLRNKTGIAVEKQSYEQEAIVATVRTIEPHNKIARQVFLPTGPLAFLPLAESNTSSIVWSLPTVEAQRLMALDDESFMAALSHAMAVIPENAESICPGDIVGGRKILATQQRFSFPLQKQQATQYIKPRIALVGDAAHVVHPLAGQGVNMGLLDAASLVDVIEDALKHQRDFASHATLRRYERWRKGDNHSMLTGVDLIKQLFASEKRYMQSWRSFGLSATNQIKFLKNFFSRQAVGNRTGLPRLAKYKG